MSTGLLYIRGGFEFIYSVIYMADVSGNTGRGRPRNTYTDPIGEVLQKGRVRSTHNLRACMTKCMNVDKAKGVCKDCSRWRSVVSAYPKGKKASVYVFMYVYSAVILKSAKFV